MVHQWSTKPDVPATVHWPQRVYVGASSTERAYGVLFRNLANRKRADRHRLVSVERMMPTFGRTALKPDGPLQCAYRTSKAGWLTQLRGFKPCFRNPHAKLVVPDTRRPRNWL